MNPSIEYLLLDRGTGMFLRDADQISVQLTPMHKHAMHFPDVGAAQNGATDLKSMFGAFAFKAVPDNVRG